jgi:hypothetical protein
VFMNKAEKEEHVCVIMFLQCLIENSPRKKMHKKAVGAQCLIVSPYIA